MTSTHSVVHESLEAQHTKMYIGNLYSAVGFMARWSGRCAWSVANHAVETTSSLEIVFLDSEGSVRRGGERRGEVWRSVERRGEKGRGGERREEAWRGVVSKGVQEALEYRYKCLTPLSCLPLCEHTHNWISV